MKIVSWWPILLIVFYISCNHQQKTGEDLSIVRKTISRGYYSRQEMDPPPPGFVSRFKTLEEWLDHIYQGEAPAAAFDRYNFGIFYGTDIKSGLDTTYTLVFSGERTYSKDGKTIINTALLSEHENTYFNLPHNEYKNLNYRQACEKLKTQLQSLTQSHHFQNSFLAKAKLITTDCQDTIWSR